jgi:hypothetical protein
MMEMTMRDRRRINRASADRAGEAPEVTASSATPPAATKPFGKCRIPAHWVVDETLKQSGTKIGIVGDPFAKR